MMHSVIQPSDEQTQTVTLQIQVNGEMQQVNQGATCADLLTQLGLGENRRVAVERNEQIVPRSDLAHVTLQSGDRIEVIQAIGGG